MLDPHERLPEEFHFKEEKPKKKFKRKEDNKKSKLALRLFSYCSSGMIVVSLTTGTIPFVEKPVEEVYVIDDSHLYHEHEDFQGIDDNQDNNISQIIEEINNQIEEENEPLPDTYITVKCDECNDTGIYCPGIPTFGYDRGNGYGYEGCGGTGYSKCPDIWCHGDYKICDTCKGGGLDKDGDPCWKCDGTGFVDCEFCHLTGIVECLSLNDHVECFKCIGRKVVYIRVIQINDNGTMVTVDGNGNESIVNYVPEFKWMTCPDCKGWKTDCETCSQTGKIQVEVK